jgi:hypothetical protein
MKLVDIKQLEKNFGVLKGRCIKDVSVTNHKGYGHYIELDLDNGDGVNFWVDFDGKLVLTDYFAHIE